MAQTDVEVTPSPGWIINKFQNIDEVERALRNLYEDNASLALTWLKNGCRTVDRPQTGA